MTLSRFWAPFPSLEERLSRVARIIEDVLESSPASVKDDLAPLLLTPGKMLRPAFFLMAASGADRDDARIYDTAAGLELLHTASLIHDDILDRALTRRGVPTLHSAVGIKKAVLEGDYLLTRAFQLVSSSYNARLVEAVNGAVERLCLSEIEQDLEKEGFWIGRDKYFGRIRGKTAELFALSLLSGAVMGGLKEDEGNALYEAGIKFGQSFQILDDILDVTGKTGITGKKSGGDIKAGIPTLPLILALEREEPIISLLCRLPLRALAAPAIRRRIVSGGFLKESEIISRRLIGECLSLVGGVDFPDRELFGKVVDKLSKREY